MQLLKHKEYTTKSDINRIRPLINPAPRGLIVDRNGIALTQNNHNYRLFLYLKNESDIKNTLKMLAEILYLDQNNQDIMLKRAKKIRKKSIVSLMDNLLWDDLARIEINAHKLPGISIEEGLIRNYLFPYETAHFVGYVSLPSEQEISKQQPSLFMHPNFMIGKSGVEKTFDSFLRGKFGIKYVEVNAFGMPLNTLSIKDGIEGKKLNLTIDIELQKFIAENIKGLVASVVVMDIRNGEITALVSSPSFNPNNFVEGISVKYWQELITNQNKPLNNKAISAIYPPGSIFKLMVALAALENGIKPSKTILCTGKHRLGNRIFHCWKKEGHGKISMSDAITQSCNIYFFTIAYQIGIKKITQMAQKFGYGEVFDIDLAGVKGGHLPSKIWKEKVFNQAWVGGDTLNSAIGQGFVLATSLQLAVSTARIANGGIPIKPHLVKDKNNNKQYQNLANKTLVDKKHLDIIVAGMNGAVNKKGGTAYYRRIKAKGFEMAGKTGTSQVISKRENEMSKKEIDQNRNHGLFVAFAPVHNPQYAVSVIVEHGGSGSYVAAPIGRDVLLKIQILTKKNTAYTKSHL